MKLNEIQDMMTEDSKVDVTKLDAEAINTPFIYAKYINIHANEKIRLKALEKKMKTLRHEKTEYYRGNAPSEVYVEKPLNITILKSQVPTYVDSDPDIMELQEKIDIQLIKIEMLEDYLKSVYQRSFNIKAAIDYLKFKQGEY